jgi:hypothetical protein
MDDRIWIPILIIVFVVLGVVAKVYQYMRKSEEEWKKVDKSRLKAWDDDKE